ncbi:hypothetical protein W02_24880 [Nitrospira sp. KM1]|uniref:SGNH/GDSL hydrolase family protein n=1 Tax=Nitrospira sp. KM1 TaxID=1936990 RepID=UPI0013A77AC8|nr:hypothetical protein [Nitrospira sp. KM1]BCA55348.1 hypothetical protein W02_24880 [Nitrospira sp. KM1]
MVIFLILGAAEAGLFLAVLSLYRAAGKPDVWYFLFSLPGIVFLCSSLLIMVCVTWMMRTVCSSDRQARRDALMGASMNLLLLPLVLGSLEATSRLLSRSSGSTETIFGIVLYPRHWVDVVSTTKSVIAEMAFTSPYLVPDPTLGWTIGPSRRSASGLRFSSTEGIRSPRLGVSFHDSRTRHTGMANRPATVRIALIGDSMTFGAEVSCEESWGHALEGLLQPDTQVLNFGVSAYGLNQTFLRYGQDVRSWNPQIVVIGISSMMLLRINSVYPFIMNPEWFGFPFVRPRLVENHARPVAINAPVSGTIDVSARSINDLPYLELDDYFQPIQWERQGVWGPLEHSYVFRLLNSVRPPGEFMYKDVSLESIRASQLVIRSLVQDIREDGAIPLIVTLPYESEFGVPNERRPTIQMLTRAGLPYHDMAGCLIDQDSYPKFVPSGAHYSSRANARIAQCLQPVLASEIAHLDSTGGRVD